MVSFVQAQGDVGRCIPRDLVKLVVRMLTSGRFDH